MNYQKLLDQVKFDEGLRLSVYKCTANKLTIGYGRNLEDNGISEDEAEELLLNDLARIEAALDREYLLVDTHNDARQSVLMNMAYQMGVRGLLGFKIMLGAYRGKDYSTAADEMLNSRWAKQTPGRAKRLAEQMRSGEWQ